MKASKFIIQKLIELIENFPQLKVSYEYNLNSSSHYVEILPSKEFRKNMDYAKYETEFIIEFISRYPLDEIVFITKNDLIEITNPIFEKAGELYFDEKISFWNSFNWSNEIIMNFNLEIKSSFNELINDINCIELPELNKIIVKPIIEEPVEIEQEITDYPLAA